jgi:cytochrome c oxidase subunit 2
LVIVGLDHARLLPIAAAKQAEPIDRLFNIHFKVIAFLFSLIVGFMLYSIVVFRRRKGDMSDAPHIEGNTRLEVLWTVIPLGVVLFFAFLGSKALAETLQPEPKPVRVRVVGSQWSWRFEYPDYKIVSNELVLPVNKQTLLELTSTDVIHSFWVPEFRVKQDLLPGGENMVRELRITPNVVGDYKVRCAELCGRLHSRMEAPVHVMETADFDQWVKDQLANISDDPVVRGQVYATVYGCQNCHSVDGTKIVGPSWKGIYGNQEALQDGSTITVDDAYIIESILTPSAKIVSGFTDLMPKNFRDQLSDAQISDIIQFIKTLK